MQSSPSSLIMASYFQCNPGDDRRFGVFWGFPPAVDTPYVYGSTSGFGAYYALGDPDGFTQTFFGSGTLTFTEAAAAAGTYAGTFTFTSGSAGIATTDGTFRITGAE